MGGGGRQLFIYLFIEFLINLFILIVFFFFFLQDRIFTLI